MLTRARDDRGLTLVELMIALLIFGLVCAAGAAWLISAGRAVATNTARSADTAAAQSAFARIDSDVRYAQNLVMDECNSPCSSQTPTYQVLYVTGLTGGCSEWYAANGDLMEQTSKENSAVIATGVSGLTFASNGSYNGLISVRFSLNQAPRGTDESPVSIYQSIAADNMPSAVQASSSSNPPCSFTG